MQDNGAESAAKAGARKDWVDQYMPVEGNDSGSSSGGLNMEALRGFVFRQRFLLVGTVLAVLLLGFVATLLISPTYQASSTVLVDNTGPKIVSGAGLTQEVSTNETYRYLNTQGDVIKSRKLALYVYDALGSSGQKALLGAKIEEQKPEGVSSQQWTNIKRERGSKILSKGIDVAIPMSSRVITITYSAGDPKLTAQVANAYADNFVLEDVRNASQINSYALKYLNEQVVATRLKLRNAELQANAYAKANAIINETPIASSTSEKESDNGSSGGQTITVSTLANVNDVYTQARSKRIAAEQRWATVASVAPSQIPEVQQNSAIQSLTGSRSTLVSQLADLRQRYGESYPQVMELKAQIATIDSQIAKTARDIKESIRFDYEIAQRQEQGLSQELNQASTATLEEQNKRVQYNLLTRESDALKSQLASLLERYNQFSSAADVKNISVIKLDSAEVPQSPVAPQVSKILLASFVLGLGLAFALGIVRELFDDRLHTPGDVEHKLGVPLLGTTPAVKDGQVVRAFDTPYSPLMEAYSSIRTSVDAALAKAQNVLQITSSQPTEGKSTTAAALAERYAALGRRVLLVDADLRKPGLVAVFGAKRAKVGTAEVLLEHADLQQSLLPGTSPNLSVLPVGTIPPNPVELIASQAIPRFIARYRTQYDMIIFDSAPVIGLADAPMLSRYVDGTIFVVEANRAQFGQAKAALRRLKAGAAHIIGVVMTKYDPKQAGEGYGYGYGYDYYSYGEKADS